MLKKSESTLASSMIILALILLILLCLTASVEAYTQDTGRKYGDFAITLHKYDSNADWDQIVRNVFGSEYRVADWNDLKTYYNKYGERAFINLLNGLGLDSYGEAASVYFNGKKYWQSWRAYFIERHNHNKPSYFLAHDNIDNYLVSLGSWRGERYILAVKKNADTQTYPVTVKVKNSDDDKLRVTLYIDEKHKGSKYVSPGSTATFGTFELLKGKHLFKISWTDTDRPKGHQSVTKSASFYISGSKTITLNVDRYDKTQTPTPTPKPTPTPTPSPPQTPTISTPPAASFTFSPSSPVVGQTVTFDASSSYDPDGAIVSYSWKFGDGSTASGMTVQHSYSAAGTYTVTLTVTDDDGATSTVSKVVVVQSSTANLPDLVVSDVKLSPSNNGWYDVYALLCNDGDAPVSSTIYTLSFLDYNNNMLADVEDADYSSSITTMVVNGATIGYPNEHPIDISLKPHSCDAEYKHFTKIRPISGKNVVIKIDTRNFVKESNEVNNIFASKVYDLSVTAPTPTPTPTPTPNIPPNISPDKKIKILKELKELAENMAKIYEGTEYQRDLLEIAAEADSALETGIVPDELNNLLTALSYLNAINKIRVINEKINSNEVDRLRAFGELQKLVFNDLLNKGISITGNVYGISTLEASLMIMPAQITSSVIVDTGVTIGKQVIEIKKRTDARLCKLYPNWDPNCEELLKLLEYENKMKGIEYKQDEPPFHYFVEKKDDGYLVHYTSKTSWDIEKNQNWVYYTPPLKSVEFELEYYYIGDKKVSVTKTKPWWCIIGCEEKGPYKSSNVDPLVISHVKFPLPPDTFSDVGIKVKLTWWSEGGLFGRGEDDGEWLIDTKTNKVIRMK